MARFLEAQNAIRQQVGGGGNRWRPPPAQAVSLALHAAAVPALLIWPGEWAAVLGTVAANHLALGLLALAPRTQWTGRTLIRLPAAAAARGEVALTFDDGPDPVVTPRVLDLLDAAGARASFFCIGQCAARFPDLVREIVRRGHTVENHSHRHATLFAAWSPAAARRDLARAQAVLTEAAGIPPRFVRAPFGIRGPFFDAAVAGTGLRPVAWTARGRDTVCGDPRLVLDRLTRRLAAGDVLLLHDGEAATAPDGEKVVLAVLPALLAALASRGLRPVTLPAAFGG